MQDQDTKEAIDVDEAAKLVAEARQEASMTAQAIAELCLIAGCPDKAAEFIAAGKTEADVRRLLVALKAADQAPEITSTIDPDKTAHFNAASANPLIQAVKRLVGKE